jgi:hypothetical protein
MTIDSLPLRKVLRNRGGGIKLGKSDLTKKKKKKKEIDQKRTRMIQLSKTGISAQDMKTSEE